MECGWGLEVVINPSKKWLIIWQNCLSITTLTAFDWLNILLQQSASGLGIDQNLQRHRAVSLRQHGFLVDDANGNHWWCWQNVFQNHDGCLYCWLLIRQYVWWLKMLLWYPRAVDRTREPWLICLLHGCMAWAVICVVSFASVCA